MVAPGDTKELFLTLTLILAFSITGLFIDRFPSLPDGPVVVYVEEAPRSISPVANPVVHISVPAHNIFAPN